MKRVLISSSLLFVVTACSTASSDGELVDSSEAAYSAPVDTEHPFDATTCNGDALTATEARTFIELAERGKSAWWRPRRKLVHGFDLWVRRRVCDIGSGACGEWSAPTKRLVDFEGYRLDVDRVGADVSLFVEHFRGNQSKDCKSVVACNGFDGAACAPLAHANIGYSQGYFVCSKSETESLTFTAHVTKSCARVTAERSFVEGGTRFEESFAAVDRVDDPCSSRMHSDGTCTWTE